MPDMDKEVILDRRQLNSNVPCQTSHDLRRLQDEVRDLQEKVAGIRVLDHRVTAVETVLTEIRVDFEAVMADINKIQISITETNLLRTWVGRIVIAILSAVLAFISAKYGTPI